MLLYAFRFLLFGIVVADDKTVRSKNDLMLFTAAAAAGGGGGCCFGGRDILFVLLAAALDEADIPERLLLLLLKEKAMLFVLAVVEAVAVNVVTELARTPFPPLNWRRAPNGC
jgi:hypothetical protein